MVQEVQTKRSPLVVTIIRKFSKAIQVRERRLSGRKHHVMHKQGENESLHNFIKCFKYETLQIGVTSKEVLLMATHAEIRRSTSMWEKNSRKPRHSTKAFYERASGYVRIEETGYTEQTQRISASNYDKKRRAQGYHQPAKWQKELSFTAKASLVHT